MGWVGLQAAGCTVTVGTMVLCIRVAGPLGWVALPPSRIGRFSAFFSDVDMSLASFRRGGCSPQTSHDVRPYF